MSESAVLDPNTPTQSRPGSPDTCRAPETCVVDDASAIKNGVTPVITKLSRLGGIAALLSPVWLMVHALFRAPQHLAFTKLSEGRWAVGIVAAPG